MDEDRVVQFELYSEKSKIKCMWGPKRDKFVDLISPKGLGEHI